MFFGVMFFLYLGAAILTAAVVSALCIVANPYLSLRSEFWPTFPFSAGVCVAFFMSLYTLLFYFG